MCFAKIGVHILLLTFELVVVSILHFYAFSPRAYKSSKSGSDDADSASVSWRHSGNPRLGGRHQCLGSDEVHGSRLQMALHGYEDKATRYLLFLAVASQRWPFKSL